MTPLLRFSIFATSLSTHQTSFPLSAKQLPATSPTYPVPITAMFIATPNLYQKYGLNTGTGKYRNRTNPASQIRIRNRKLNVQSRRARIVQSATSDLGFEMQDSSNFEIHS